MSTWNKIAASVGLVLVALGLTSLFTLAAGNPVAGYWWGAAFGLIVLGGAVLFIETAPWRGGKRGPDAVSASPTPKPHVVFSWCGGGFTNLSTMEHLSTGAEGPIVASRYRVQPDEVEVLLVSVSNVPTVPSDETIARNAVGSLRFFAPEDLNTPLVETEARWTTNDQAQGRMPWQSVDDLKRRDLLSNGERNDLDLVIRHAGEPAFYVAGPAIWSAPAARNPALRLDGSRYLAEVSVRGSNFERVTGWFAVGNVGKPVGDTRYTFTIDYLGNEASGAPAPEPESDSS